MKPPAVAGLAVLVAAGFAVIWWSWNPTVAANSAAISGVIIAVATWVTRRQPMAEPDFAGLLDRAAENLALAVAAQWRDEERLRRLNDPVPLPVQWAPADAEVSDHWVNISHEAVLWPQALSGTLANIARVFGRVPSRRLVVLGGLGAGKSVLAIRFALDFLDCRSPGDPVPVIFPVCSWHPGQQRLLAWMSQCLADEYPAVGAGAPAWLDWPGELVRTGRVLPVLDGLDEIPASLRGQAMQELNAAFAQGAPVFLTCRTRDYTDTVTRRDVFTSAAVVQLKPLTLEQLREYLPRTAPPMPGALAARHATKWDTVLAYLRDNPADPVAQTVADVLSVPLMTSLARAIYSDTPADPACLLHARFADPEVLRAHLLEAFIPAVYSHHPALLPAPRGAHSHYTPEQAVTWLRFLARHMGTLQTRDLAWWQLSAVVPKRTRGFLAALVCGIAMGAVGIAISVPAIGVAYGLAYALAAGLSYGLDPRLEPIRAELRLHVTRVHFLGRAGAGLAIGVALGFGFALPAAASLAVGLAFTLAIGMHAWVDRPADAAKVASPAAVLGEDWVATFAFGLSFAFPFGLLYGLCARYTPLHSGGPVVGLFFGLSAGLWFALAGAFAGAIVGFLAVGRIGAVAYSFAGAVAGGLLQPPAGSTLAAVTAGLLFGIAIWFQVMFAKASGMFRLTTAWLALRGQLPWHLMRFLEDAHRRGVLRQTGGIYQFRHGQLHDHLLSPGAMAAQSEGAQPGPLAKPVPGG